MAGSLAFTALSPAFGFVVDAAGLGAAHLALAVLFLAGAGALLAVLIRPGPDALHGKIREEKQA
jgi:hypothetical protein